jgi:hypothetical protein
MAAPEASADLAGAAGTSAVGAVAVPGDVPLTGESATASIGSLAPVTALSGVAATGSVGTLSTLMSLSGVAASGSVGTVMVSGGVEVEPPGLLRFPPVFQRPRRVA